MNLYSVTDGNPAYVFDGPTMDQKASCPSNYSSRILAPRLGKKANLKVLTFPESVVCVLKHGANNIGPSTSGSSSKSNPLSANISAKRLKPFPVDQDKDLSSVPIDRDITLKELIECRAVFEVFEVEVDCGIANHEGKEMGQTSSSISASKEKIGTIEDAKKEEAEKERRKLRRFRILEMFSFKQGLKGNMKS